MLRAVFFVFTALYPRRLFKRQVNMSLLYSKKETASRAALVLAVFLAVFMLLSAAVEALEAGHECTGENCPVCILAAAVGRLSAALCSAAPLAASPAAPPPNVRCGLPLFGFYGISPVSAGVRLDI